MAYTYKKLTDVELVDSAIEPNLLIEENGDIKKMPASNIASSQVRADWNEEDATSPAFILNKPTSLGGGNGTRTITYSLISGALWNLEENRFVTQTEFIDEWNNGSILRIESSWQGTIYSTNIIAYRISSGSSSISAYYMFDEDDGKLKIAYVDNV